MYQAILFATKYRGNYAQLIETIEVPLFILTITALFVLVVSAIFSIYLLLRAVVRLGRR